MWIIVHHSQYLTIKYNFFKKVIKVKIIESLSGFPSHELQISC